MVKSRMGPRGASLLSFLVLLSWLPPGAILAQTLPGQPRSRDRWEVEKARYRALMLERVSVTISEWQDAWDADKADDLAALYTENGFLLLSESEVQGRPSIQEYFEGVLPEMGSLSFSMTEFEAAGSLAMIVAAYGYSLREDGSPQEYVSGRCIAVLEEENDEWRIRSQIFRPQPF